MSQTLLYVNNTDPEDGGGGDRRLFEEAATLHEKGADVQVVASRTDPEFPQRRVSNGVQIRTVKCVPDFLQRAPTLHFYLARSLFPLVSLPILFATLFRDDIDVVVDNHTPHPSLVAFFGPLFSVPVVALVHEYHDRSAIEKYPLPVGVIQLLVQNFLRIRLYAAVIVPREETKEALRRYGTSIPIHVVPNGLDVDTYLEPPVAVEAESFDFVVVSRLVHRKGIDQLLEAMALVAAEYPSVQLGIAGSGPERDRLERQAAELGISEHVTFLGFVSEERKRALLHESSVFVLPSRQEGFGIAVLEAMATGTPVVANDLDIIRRLVPEGPNRLADASDPEVFATAMMDVLNADRDGEQVSTPENREEAERYSLDRVGEQATSVYNQVRTHT
ncbi:glycosyltransferase family 1 protein [Halorubrum sp. SS5]|nr:glycosyltransferase family 1 protein [Halorubrum sp. SS5]